MRNLLKALALFGSGNGNGTGGTGGGSADWNASEGEAGHVKNRTHWEEKPTVYLSEKTFPLAVYQYYIGVNHMPIAGKTYRVTVNGVGYEVVAKDALYDGRHGVVLGNGHLCGAAYFDDADVPFGVVCYETPWDSSRPITANLGSAIVGAYNITIEGDDAVLLEGHSVNCSAVSESSSYFASDTLEMPIVGKTYTIVFDGVSYDCVAEEAGEDGDRVYLGTKTWEYDDFPFGLDFGKTTDANDNSFTFINLFSNKSGSPKITIVIEGEVHKLDKKFLPDDVGGGGIKTAIMKIDGYDNALAGIATTAGGEETFSYTCLNMTYEEARQIMLAGEPLSILVMDYNNFGVHSHYATDVTLSAYYPIICFVDGLNSRDINWGNRGVSTSQNDASDYWDS